jgi:hypothetical protein
VEKRFLYHAQAAGFSGSVTLPFNDLIEVQSASTLPVTGGYSAARVENFRYKQIASFASAATLATGSYDPHEKVYNTLVNATVEKLNILNQVTVDLVSAHLTSKHTLEDSQASIIPLGSAFQNLRIGGCAVHVELDTAAFSEHDTFDRICARLASDKELRCVALHGQEEMPLPPPRGKLMCSLVKEVRTTCRELKVKGNTIVVPHFGTVYLGEYLIQPYARNLTMIRVELGCPVNGAMTVASISGDGEGYP